MVAGHHFLVMEIMFNQQFQKIQFRELPFRRKINTLQLMLWDLLWLFPSKQQKRYSTIVSYFAALKK